MNTVYEFIKNLIPCQIYTKKRENGDFLIISNENLELYFLNETAKDFYMRCDSFSSIDNICNSMLKEYDVDENVLKQDILSLIRDFQWQEIIELKERV